MKFIDFSKCPLSNRHGTYGGQAGDKDGIVYNNEFWIIKFPKNTGNMKGASLEPYTTSPLSEYLGSHIYSLLGYPVHETLLGSRNGKVVVACKDFCETRGALSEVRTLKNAANRQISETLGDAVIPESQTGDSVNLNELMLHMNVNKFLSQKKVIERFWDTAVIDIFINNNDRNNGNWGLLFNETDGTYSLAPIYDNGNSFYNKTSENRLKTVLNSDSIENYFKSNRTTFFLDGRELSVKELLAIDNADLKKALLKNVPLIESKLPEIQQFINELPANVGEYSICSDSRKMIYCKMLDFNFRKVLLPRYEVLKEKSVLAELKKNKNILRGEDKGREKNFSKKKDDISR